MAELLTDLVPLLAFMLIPIWIPLTGALFGAVADRIRPPAPSAARIAVDAAKAMSAELRDKTVDATAPRRPAAGQGRRTAAADSIAA